jgi:transcription elongation factor GreA
MRRLLGMATGDRMVQGAEYDDSRDSTGGRPRRGPRGLNEMPPCGRMEIMDESASEGGVLLTPEGRAKLAAELEHLRTVKRPQVANQLRQAIDGGDLSENIGYEDAKHEQSFVEGRILTLETLLKRAVIIEGAKCSETVDFGSRVTVRERGGGEESFRVVGSAEADPGNGCISNESPLGKALLNHKVGDEVAVEAPDGLLYFHILDIQ